MRLAIFSFPFLCDSSSFLVSIEGLDFCGLVDTGAAVTAVSANVWNKYLSDTYPSLNVFVLRECHVSKWLSSEYFR